MIEPIEGRDLPYVTRLPDGGRLLVYMSFYDTDEKQFHAYAHQPDGTFFSIRPVDMAAGTYVARSPADKTRDVHLPLAEMVFQHFSLAPICALLTKIEHDLQNALSSIHKYFVLLEHSKRSGDDTGTSLISTEIEYAIGNHRSFYDLIHRMVMAINATYHPNPCQLKDSFAKLAQKDHSYLCTELLLPPALADFYISRARLFLLLREARDNIFHHGHTPNTIYAGDDGFSVMITEGFGKRFEGLNLWPEELLKPNRLGSVLAIVERIVHDMFDTMTVLCDALANSFDQLPAAVADGHHVYLRSPLVQHCHLLDGYRREHWFNPKDVLARFPNRKTGNDAQKTAM